MSNPKSCINQRKVTRADFAISQKIKFRGHFCNSGKDVLLKDKRSRVDPTLLNDFEMATKGNGDPPVLDLQTMEELCQPSLNGRGGTFMKRHLEECYDLIENITAHIMIGILQPNGPPLAKTRSYMLREPIKRANDVILKNMQTNITSLKNSNLELKNMFGQFMKMNTASSSGSRTLPSTTVTNLKEDLKVEGETEVTKDTMPPTNNRSTKDVQPPVSQIETLIPNSKPVVAPIAEPVAAPVSALTPNQKSSIPYPSRLHDQNLHDKTNDQKEKFFQIFKDLDFNISFADALILMLKFGSTIKSLLTNKDKLFELARTLLNEHYLAVLHKKLPEKLGDPSKFLIPCDFFEMDECLALVDLSASINIMPLSV
nr:reverse transcriptase domain-containing protein [Tanacetum cinerariifolium]